MVIPNKHSGYQAGIRRYYTGGGGSGGVMMFPPSSNADPYTSANRPNYVPFGTNGQYNQPIYQPQSQNYNMSNPMNVSQYGTAPGANMIPQMPSALFNPYQNSYQPPPQFNFQQQQQPQQQQSQPAVQPNYGPSQAIVGRSSQMRGTPNIMRRAEGGIAALTDSVG
jgi:hypothetical protein